MADNDGVHVFRTADGCLIQTTPAPEHLGGGNILTLTMTGKDDARRASVHLRPHETGQISDGHHTFDELYRIRMLYHAAFVNEAHQRNLEWKEGPRSVKSWRHSDGELCFGGGWFIVTTHLWDGNDGKPSGQISNHYEAKYWDLFQVPEVELPPEWDGHTPEQGADRLEHYLRREWMRSQA